MEKVKYLCRSILLEKHLYSLIDRNVLFFGLNYSEQIDFLEKHSPPSLYDRIMLTNCNPLIYHGYCLRST